jgi:hypothetical protein
LVCFILAIIMFLILPAAALIFGFGPNLFNQ